MNKIVQFNESLKTCKEILDNKLLHKWNILLVKIEERINSNTSIEKHLNEIIGIVIDKHDQFNELTNNIVIDGEKIKEISYDIVDHQKYLLNHDFNENKSNSDKDLINRDLEVIKPDSLEVLIEKMVTNYQINYFLSNILLLEMLIKNLYNILNKIEIKYNYHVKNSSFIYIFFKIIFYYLYYSVSYYKYIKSKGENYKINLINYPDNYLDITHYIGENILKTINGNGCYCENEIKIDNDHSVIKFNLLFSNLEINLNLLKIFNSIENKICNSDQSLQCKVSNKNKDKELEIKKEIEKPKKEMDLNKFPEEIRNKIILNRNLTGATTSLSLEKKNVRKYHTSTRTNNKIIKMKESDFLDKEKKYNDSLFNILEKIKHLTSTPYEPKDVQQCIEDHWTYLIKKKL